MYRRRTFYGPTHPDGTVIFSQLTYDDIAESTAWLRGVLNETPTDRPGIHIGPPVDRLEITFRRPQPIFKIRIEGDLSGFTIIGLYPSGGRIILSSSVDAAPSYEVLTHAGASGPLEGLSLCSAGQSLIKKIEIFRVGFRPWQPTVIKPSGGDDTVRIQRAIDELAARGGGDYTFPPRTRLGNSNIRIPANVRLNTADDSSVVGTNFIQVPAPSPLDQLTNAAILGRERRQGARIPFSIRSNGGTHFTEALRYLQSSDANLVGLADNNIRIRRVTAQSLQDLDMELMFWRSDTFDSVNINEDSFCGRVSLSHGRRVSEGGRYYYDVPNLDIPYEDLDGTYELHIALQNRGQTDKPAGDSGRVVVEVFYELGLSNEPMSEESRLIRHILDTRDDAAPLIREIMGTAGPESVVRAGDRIEVPAASSGSFQRITARIKPAEGQPAEGRPAQQCVFFERVCWAHDDSCRNGLDPSRCGLAEVFRAIPEIMDAVENCRRVSRERVHELVLGHFNRYELHNPTTPEWRRTRDRHLDALPLPPTEAHHADNDDHATTMRSIASDHSAENPPPRGRTRQRTPTPALPAGTCQGCGGRGTATNSHTLSEGPCEICHGSGRSPSAEQGIDGVAIMNPVSHRRRRPRYRGHRRRDWSRRRRRRTLPPRDGHGHFRRQTTDEIQIAAQEAARRLFTPLQQAAIRERARRAQVSASMESNLSVVPITQDVYRSEPHIVEIPITTSNPTRGTNMVVGDYMVPTGIEFMFTPEQKPLFRIKPLSPPEANWKRRFGITIDIMDAMLAQLKARIYNAKLEDYENPQVPEDNHFRLMGRARQGDRIRVLVQNDTENMREWDLQVRLQATRLMQVSGRKSKDGDV